MSSPLSIIPNVFLNAVKDRASLSALSSEVYRANKALRDLVWHDRLWRLRAELPPGAVGLTWDLESADDDQGSTHLYADNVCIEFQLPDESERRFVTGNAVDGGSWPEWVTDHARKVGAIAGHESADDRFEVQCSDLHDLINEYRADHYEDDVRAAFPNAPLFLEAGAAPAPAAGAVAGGPVGTVLTQVDAALSQLNTGAKLQVLSGLRQKMAAVEEEVMAERWHALVLRLPVRPFRARWGISVSGFVFDFAIAGRLVEWFVGGGNWSSNPALASAFAAASGLASVDDVDAAIPAVSAADAQDFANLVISLGRLGAEHGYTPPEQ